MRFELTTSTLARWRSTTELRPLSRYAKLRAQRIRISRIRASENVKKNELFF
ncbi:MAG: hypothetical protein RL117_1497 [Verrucomicrobiota bacterium]|jgi:hypothetical protein